MSNIVTLGDICNFINGGAWSDKEYVEVGIPVLKVSNIKPSGFVLDEVSHLPESSLEKYRVNILKKNDLVIATVGSHPNLESSAAGRTTRITDLATNYLLNQNAVCIRTKNPNELNQKYLCYLSISHDFQHYIQSCGRGAANQMRIAIGAIKEYEFFLPPISVQNRIADILSAYDDLIENNLKQIKLLEEAATSLYREWFVFLRFPGHENIIVTEGVPEGWVTMQIKDVCLNTNSGGTPSRNNEKYWSQGTVNWFKTQELVDCCLFNSEEKITEKGLENSSAKIFPKNTILMAIYASPTLGRLGILTENSSFNQAALALLADEKIISHEWLYLKLFELRNHFNAIARGAGQQNINVNIVQTQKIVVPSYDVILEFKRIIAPLFDLSQSLQKQNIQLRKARDALLPRLMAGMIDVGK